MIVNWTDNNNSNYYHGSPNLFHSMQEPWACQVRTNIAIQKPCSNCMAVKKMPAPPTPVEGAFSLSANGTRSLSAKRCDAWLSHRGTNLRQSTGNLRSVQHNPSSRGNIHDGRNQNRKTHYATSRSHGRDLQRFPKWWQHNWQTGRHPVQWSSIHLYFYDIHSIPLISCHLFKRQWRRAEYSMYT